MSNQNIWVIVEEHNGAVKRVSLELLQKASAMAADNNQKAVAVIISKDPSAHAQAAFANGADEIIAVKQAPTFEASAYIVEKLSEKYAPLGIFVGSTHFGKDLAGAVSARMRLGVAVDSTNVFLAPEGDGYQFHWVRPSYDGKLNAAIEIAGFPQIGTFHAGAFKLDEAFPAKPEGQIIEEEIEVPVSVLLTTILGFTPDDELMKTNIEDADILISGGRGVGSKEGFEPLFELASLVGGNVAASRAATDEEWVERDRQVGITGKYVSPKLYIALGISGQEPHVAGMKESEVIVAVNTDPNAPIFKIAHYKVVADLHEVVKTLIERIKANQ